MLRHLAGHPGQLVIKDALMQACWPATTVTDDSLVQCIHEIRTAIGDDAHAVLRTVPRRGYRLMPQTAAPEHAALRGRSWRVVAAVALTGLALAAGLAGIRASGPAAEKPLVAVLPFEPLTEDQSARLLAAGLTEDLITDLARFPEFEVLARDSTKDRGDPGQVATSLGARFVIEGAISQQADRLRITAQLVDARTGRPLWSNRWDRPAADFFAVQSEIAETIANRLGGGAGLVQQTGRNAARRKPPASLDAYELYLLGTERLERITVPEVEAALGLLNRAVALDPGLARAWIEIYHARRVLASFGVTPEENLRLADAAARRALALDPADAEAHAVMAMSLAHRNEFARAKVEMDIALALAPNAAEILTFYAAWASNFDEPERGAAVVDRILQLDPNFPTWAARLYGYAYFMAGRHEDALGMIDRLAPENYSRMTWVLKPAALAALGRTEAAALAVAQAVAARPDLSIESVANEAGHNAAERARLVEAMRLAAFPACAKPEELAAIAEPVRLPECLVRAEAAPP